MADHAPDAPPSPPTQEHHEAHEASPPASENAQPTTSPNTATPETAPTANGSATATLQNVKDTVVNSKFSIFLLHLFSDHPDIQQKLNLQLKRSRTILLSRILQMVRVADILEFGFSIISANKLLGPVATNVKDQAAKTSSEFQDLANARTVPPTPAITGQPLTQYHSIFYRLLSWQNPRATGIMFAATVLLIFAARYLNILKYALKGTYFILGVVSSIEITGKLLFDDGLATKMRPKKYWTIPRESLERSVEDIEQLLNFFVIEVQRIVWAENIVATAAAFTSALISYWLIKLVPLWGLALIGTCVVYLAPLVYVKNRQAIDNGIEEVSTVITSQANQLKHLTAEHTGKATESLKSYTSEYTQKAQELIGSRKNSGSHETKASDFPTAPKQEPLSAPAAAAPTEAEHEPLLAH